MVPQPYRAKILSTICSETDSLRRQGLASSMNLGRRLQWFGLAVALAGTMLVLLDSAALAQTTTEARGSEVRLSGRQLSSSTGVPRVPEYSLRNLADRTRI